LCGQSFVLLHHRTGCQRGQLILQAADGAELRILAQWTDLREPDEYAQLGTVGTELRVPDLLALSELIALIRKEGQP
jgi:hypothetical protein